MPHLQREQIEIFYELSGSGPLITLINGHTRPLSDFRMMSKFLHSQGFSTLALDNRGAGQTLYKSPFTIKDLSSDVVFLWKELKVTESHLLGISMGGVIAMNVALNSPTTVKSLILASTYDGKELSARNHEPSQAASEKELLQSYQQYFAPEFAERNQLLISAMAKQAMKTGTLSKGGARDQRQALSDAQLTTSQLKSIKCPTLVIHGEQDRIIAVSEAERLASCVPNAHLKIYPEAGHLLIAEKSKSFYKDIADFCLADD